MTVIFLGGFGNEQSYISPIHHILYKDKLLKFPFQINSQDHKDLSLEEAYLIDQNNDEDNDSIFDVEMITLQNKKLLIFSGKNQIFIEPICFPNESFHEESKNSFSQQFYLGCTTCLPNTYSDSLNSQSCQPFQDWSKDQAIGILNWKDIGCIDNSLKGPLCQNCEDFQSEFLQNERNIKLLNYPLPTKSNEQVVCSFECKEDNFDLLKRFGDDLFESSIPRKEGECVQEKEIEQYDNLCLRFKDCFECSYHPFCSYNNEQQMCFKMVNNFENFSEIDQSQIFKKYLKCQSSSATCNVNTITQKMTGLLSFINNDEELSILSFDENQSQLELEVRPKFLHLAKFQVCSWYIDSLIMPEDSDYLLTIETLEGVIVNETILPATLTLCHSIQDLSTEQECTLLKIDLKIGDNLIKEIKFNGGKFRVTLQFEEEGLIDISKLLIYYTIQQTQQELLAVVLSLISVILVMIFSVLYLTFHKKISHFFRMRCNNISFWNWRNNQQQPQQTAKKILKNLVKEKLVKQKKRLNSQDNNLYEQSICSICLVEFCSRDPMSILICQHNFHQGCFEEWVKVQSNPVTCPICKISLNKSAFDAIGSLKIETNKSLKDPQPKIEIKKEQELLTHQIQEKIVQPEISLNINQSTEANLYEEEMLLVIQNQSNSQNA